MRKFTLFLSMMVAAVAAMAQDYSVPAGTSYATNYLTAVTTDGAEENVDYTADAHPGSIHNVLPQKVKIVAGESFTLNLVAYSLGEYSVSTVREDIRYCHASLFTDFDGDCDFGVAVQKWGVKPPTHNVGGNYEECMNITTVINVPLDAKIGTTRIRVIYTNAWGEWPAADASNLDKGIAYDIEVEVVASEVPSATFTYQFIYKGEMQDEYAYETKGAIGEEFPEVAKTFQPFVKVIKPEGVVEESDNGAVFVLEVVEDLPFVAADALENINTWYYARIHTNLPSYMYSNGMGSDVHWQLNGAAIETIDEANADAYTWGFVGNLEDGFKVVSKAGGAIKSTGSGNVTIADYAEATAFVLSPSNTDKPGAFCLLNQAYGQYVNAQSGGVNHWNDNDAGSSFVLTERIIDDGTTGIENVEADAAQVIYDLTGRRIDSITKAGIYIVNGKKVLVK
ncbi:MAG: hypothetical protein IJY44_02315 [Bacteroidaceae bacterium]|nr:hypothetical protein [Bacteroidaceae bacterium]